MLDGTVHVDGRSPFTPDGIKVVVRNIAAEMSLCHTETSADRGHLNAELTFETTHLSVYMVYVDPISTTVDPDDLWEPDFPDNPCIPVNPGGTTSRSSPRR